MPSITYYQPSGTSQTVVVDAGVDARVMQTALANGVPGIVGECGGQAMCATCHVYVREEYLESLPEISEDEEEMLDVTASERDERRSRLGCQIGVNEDLDHIEVDLPEEQI